MSKRIASKAKAKRALRKGHKGMYKPNTSSKNKGNVKKGSWGIKQGTNEDKIGKFKVKSGFRCDKCHKNKASKAFYDKAFCSTCYDKFHGATLKKYGLR